MRRTPAEVRQIFLYVLAVPIILGWVTSLVVWALRGDIAGLTVTTPLMLILLSIASGVKLTKGNGPNG